jgi:hypothetical protein
VVGARSVPASGKKKAAQAALPTNSERASTAESFSLRRGRGCSVK